MAVIGWIASLDVVYAISCSSKVPLISYRQTPVSLFYNLAIQSSDAVSTYFSSISSDVISAVCPLYLTLVLDLALIRDNRLSSTPIISFNNAELLLELRYENDDYLELYVF